jgi:peptidoglycan/LPS O-acetylase OafA/YrhL
VEEHFYLLWPGLLCILLRFGRGFLSTVFLALGFGLWRAVDLHVHLTAQVLPFLDTDGRTDYRLDGLLWGCAAAFLLQRPEIREFLVKRVGRLIFVLSLLFYFLCLVRPVHLTAIWMAMLIPCLILGTVTHERWLLSRILDLAPVRWIGRISYSLYLWQQLFMVPTWERHVLPHVQRPYVNVVMCFLCAAASYYVVERPIIRLGRWLAAHRRASSPIDLPEPSLAAVGAREQ